LPPATTIDQTKQLVVEGDDAVRFFKALLKHVGLGGIQVHNFGGISELAAFLKALRDTRGFRETVASVGIVRDADNDSDSAFESAQGAVRGAGWDVPQQPMVSAGQDPKVAILILPGAGRPGMLEDLLLEAVGTDPVMGCVDEYFRCVAQSAESSPRLMAKARAHAFLASRQRPQLRVGEAAEAGYWRLDSAAYNHVREFLRGL
jgi:hypothetical protein